MNLKDYQELVRELAKKKGYNQELFYLHSRLVQEAGELLEAIWEKKSGTVIELEGADVLHFVFQLLDLVPDADIDRGMMTKIKSNMINKKKTKAKDGSMIRK